MSATVLAGGLLPTAESHAQSNGSYSLNWSTISGGGVAHMRSSCYELSGYIDFVSAPGILYGNASYTLFSGFWVAAPIFGQDEIFFNGFEECN